MSYIGVAPQDQTNFQYKVTEAQKDFSSYSYPTTKEEYWQIVDKHWLQIKNILLEFTYLDPDDLDKWAKERNPERLFPAYINYSALLIALVKVFLFFTVLEFYCLVSVVIKNKITFLEKTINFRRLLQNIAISGFL